MTVPCPRCAVPAIYDLVVILAGPDDVRGGLLGWASAVIGSFRVDGLAIRVTLDGKRAVTWPSRRGHATVMPVEPELFRRVEAAVLAAYARQRSAMS